MTQKVTVEEFRRFQRLPENQDRRLELINGVIIEIETILQRGLILGNLAAHLHTYFKENRIGWAAISVHYHMIDDEYNVPLVDIAVITKPRRPSDEEFASIMPDMAIQIKTPNQSIKFLRQKSEYYRSYGTKVVWLVYPEKRMIEVSTLDDIMVYSSDEIIEGGELLPGFKVRVSDIVSGE